MALKPSQMTTTCRLVAALLLLLVCSPPAASGQQPAASCTASLITSFTPCFSYLTNSSGGAGAAPTRDCCRSLAALVNASAGCACLVLTGAVPLGLGGVLPAVNRTLAVSLPRACASSTPVPLQCQDTSTTQTPAAPGPAADAPSQLTPLPPATPADPTATAPVSQGQTRQTTVLPSSSARRRATARVPAAAAAVLLLAVGAALV